LCHLGCLSVFNNRSSCNEIIEIYKTDIDSRWKELKFCILVTHQLFLLPEDFMVEDAKELLGMKDPAVGCQTTSCLGAFGCLLIRSGSSIFNSFLEFSCLSFF